MTSRERMLTAMKNEKPDMVPVAPDISNMIPARMALRGRPFWDIYMHDNPALWSTYIEAAKYFEIDGWFMYGSIDFQTEDQKETSTQVISQTTERMVTRTVVKTPEGDLWSENTYYIADPPTTTRKYIKDFPQDFPKLKYFFPQIKGYDATLLKQQRKELGELGVFGIGLVVPGFHELFGWFDGGLEAVTYAYYDHYDLLKEFISRQEAYILRQLDMILDVKPDFILTGGSGAITLASPAIFRELGLPSLKKITQRAEQIGVLTQVHCCGLERDLVEMATNETYLNSICPLEPPPMGDCDLAELKRSFGKKISLMGNIHTTDVMLLGTPDKVEKVAKKCIDDAAEGGGFILSTGDQCGRDTPDENIFKLVEVARTYGKY